MHIADTEEPGLREIGTKRELRQQSHLLLQLAENSLAVAEDLRDHYFRNTAHFVAALRGAIHDPRRRDPLIAVSRATATWTDLGPEVATFVDAGIGRVPIAGRMPILLRVGAYTVRTGERHLAEREQFVYRPVILGDLEGGTKARDDFPDLVRVLAELLGALIALEQTPDIDILLLHGPLMPPVGVYAGHAPFTERDIDRFLGPYAARPEGNVLKSDFLDLAVRVIYPRMTQDAAEWSTRRLFEPLAFIAFLYRRLFRVALSRTPVPLIAGVVERSSQLREFSESVLLERVFQRLRHRGNERYFNDLFGREGLDSPAALLDQLGYTDALLLAMLLEPGEYTEPWVMRKAQDLHARNEVIPPDGAKPNRVDYTPLRDPALGFPPILGSYLRVSETTAPMRLETFADLGPGQVDGIAARAHLYARLLPGYGFPVGLDIADKYAHVPRWLLEAYGKLIRHHLGVGVQRGEIDDAEMRRLIVQALYFKDRDWLFRPSA